MSPGFVMLPNEVMALRLKANDLGVLALLYWHRNGVTGRCDPSISVLAEESRMNRTTVVTCLQRLAKAGVIKIERRPNQTSTYFMVHETSTTGVVQNEYYQANGSTPFVQQVHETSTTGCTKRVLKPHELEPHERTRRKSTDVGTSVQVPTDVSAGDSNLVAFWIDRSREYHGGLCPESGGKVAGFFKRMKHIPDEMHRKAIPAFFKLSDQWLQDHGYTIEAYEKRVGALIAQVQGRKKDEPPWEGGLGRRRASTRW